MSNSIPKRMGSVGKYNPTPDDTNSSIFTDNGVKNTRKWNRNSKKVRHRCRALRGKCGFPLGGHDKLPSNWSRNG